MERMPPEFMEQTVQQRVLRDIECPTCRAILAARFGDPVRTSQFEHCLRRCDACGIAFSNSNDSPAQIARKPEQAEVRLYTLMAPDHSLYRSPVKGELGGYWPKRIYGRLDCSNAKRQLAKGCFKRHRVFFADEATAKAVGCRPCAKCLPAEYASWKAVNSHAPLHSDRPAGAAERA